jgi:hypothetical protein
MVSHGKGKKVIKWECEMKTCTMHVYHGKET